MPAIVTQEVADNSDIHSVPLEFLNLVDVSLEGSEPLTRLMGRIVIGGMCFNAEAIQVYEFQDEEFGDVWDAVDPALKDSLTDMCNVSPHLDRPRIDIDGKKYILDIWFGD